MGLCLKNIGYNFWNNIKRRIPLKQNNEDELIEIIGKTRLSIDDTPGRGLFKDDDDVRLIQVAMPAAGETSLEVINSVQAEAEAMDHAWDGARPKPIPMVPDELFEDDVNQYGNVEKFDQNGILPIGLDYDEVQLVGYDPVEDGNLAVFGNGDRLYRALQVGLAHALDLFKQTRVIIFDTDRRLNGSEYPNVNRIVQDDQEIIDAKDSLAQIFAQRKDTTKSYKWIYVYITNIDKFKKVTEIDDLSFEQLMTNANERKIAIIYAGLANKFYSGGPYAQYAENALFTQSIGEQTFFNLATYQKEKPLEKGQAYLGIDGQIARFKLVD